MRTTERVAVAAPAEVVWSVYADVERWPTWTRSVTRVQPLDGAELAPGHRFRITQPRLPVLEWQVTEVRPGRSWTWTARSPGARTDAWHEVVPDGQAAVVVLGLDQRGLLGPAVALLLRRLTRRYLALEADGLRRASEERARGPGRS